MEQSEQLPNIICSLCVNELQKSFDFRAKIIKYQEKLTSFIEGNNRDEEEIVLKIEKDVEILYEVIDENYEEPTNPNEQKESSHNCLTCSTSKLLGFLDNNPIYNIPFRIY